MTEVICPHCEEELGFADICWDNLKKGDKEIDKVVYYCSNCKKILGFSEK